MAGLFSADPGNEQLLLIFQPPAAPFTLTPDMQVKMRDAVLGLGPGCQRALGNVNLTLATPPGALGGGQVNLLAALSDTTGMRFFDINGREGRMTLSRAGIVDRTTGQPYAGDPTLLAYFGDQTKFASETINNTILLGRLFFENPAYQNLFLVREDLHSVFSGTTVGGLDVDIANYFNLQYDRTLSGQALVTAAGNAINAWLQSDCGAK